MIPDQLTNDEDRLFSARINDLFELSEKKYSPVYSCFLDERQCLIAMNICKHYDESCYILWGGYELANRKMLSVYNVYDNEHLKKYYQENEKSEMPIKCLTFEYRSEDTLSHRDFLGAIMALRLKRETIGDIVVSTGKAQLFATEVASKLIMNSVTKIGRVGVRIRDDLPFELSVEQDFEEINSTVASLRIDSVVSTAIKQSREKTVALIKNIGVQVNYTTIYSPSTEVKCGDIFSVKGYGKFALSNVLGFSKKGRTHIIIKKYK